MIGHRQQGPRGYADEPFGVLAGIQLRVVGALLLREMQTRFGRENLGFLWLFAEPLLLALAIGGIKRAASFDDGTGLPPEITAIIGYVPFFLFRAIVNRSSNAIHSNLTLMFHRQVTMLDTMVARNLLETGACGAVIVVLLLGIGHFTGVWPGDPLLMIAGFLAILGWSNGLALLVAAGCARHEWLERFIHPITYVMMPLSGAFFSVQSLNTEIQRIVLWNPQVHMHEVIREGMFTTLIVSHYDWLYIIGAVLIVNLLGLSALRAVRPNLDRF
jgi:capsular polysaccharide transport system permease protein